MKDGYRQFENMYRRAPHSYFSNSSGFVPVFWPSRITSVLLGSIWTAPKLKWKKCIIGNTIDLYCNSDTRKEQVSVEYIVTPINGKVCISLALVRSVTLGLTGGLAIWIAVGLQATTKKTASWRNKSFFTFANYGFL